MSRSLLNPLSGRTWWKEEEAPLSVCRLVWEASCYWCVKWGEQVSFEDFQEHILKEGGWEEGRLPWESSLHISVCSVEAVRVL